MVKYLPGCFLLSFVLFSVFSCEPEEEIITRNPEASLQFSADSVLFDTVFVETRSVTKRLWVYNFNKNAVLIDEIKLSKQTNSAFKVNISGKETALAKDVRILGNDSLLILVTVLIEPDNTDKPFLVTDALVFTLNNNVQDVKLVASGQNAYFHKNQLLDCNCIWKADKPHVIYNKVVVGNNCTLTIEKGTRIYLHQDATIDIGGTLLINGTAQERVVFTGDRLERYYEAIPKQWEGIRFFTTSKNNELRYADIKNANVGILAGIPDKNPANFEVRLENCIIQNMYTAGILSYTSDIQVINSLITNCGQYAVAGIGGGTYDFKYTTIANYTPDFKRETPSVYFTDRIMQTDGGIIDFPVKVTMTNSIVWGGKRNGKLGEELLFNNPGGTTLELGFNYNILQTEQYKSILNTTNIFNQEPGFKNAPEGLRPVYPFVYSLAPGAVADGKATPLPNVKTDILDTARDAVKPDIGAYELK